MSAEYDGSDSKENPEGKRFSKLDGADYERVNEFLRDRTNITAREWAIARLCQDFRTETGVEMTKIGENLPDLVPFMTGEYSRHSVGSAKAAFDEKVQMAANTFYYGAMCGFYSADELDDIMYEARETAQFMLEVEGASVGVEDAIDVDERVGRMTRELHDASKQLQKDLDDGE